MCLSHFSETVTYMLADHYKFVRDEEEKAILTSVSSNDMYHYWNNNYCPNDVFKHLIHKNKGN